MSSLSYLISTSFTFFTRFVDGFFFGSYFTTNIITKIIVEYCICIFQKHSIWYVPRLNHSNRHPYVFPLCDHWAQNVVHISLHRSYKYALNYRWSSYGFPCAIAQHITNRTVGYIQCTKMVSCGCFYGPIIVRLSWSSWDRMGTGIFVHRNVSLDDDCTRIVPWICIFENKITNRLAFIRNNHPELHGQPLKKKMGGRLFVPVDRFMFHPCQGEC